MTNGEKIKAIFPSMIVGFITESQIGVYFVKNQNSASVFSLDWWNAEYKEPITNNDLALIHIEGLDEEIRCTMCTNYMKSDRGCDGSCVVNKDMYKAVMDVIEKRIQPTTKNDLGVIDRAELLKAMDTWDKFGCDEDTKLVPYQDHYIPYIHYDDVIKCIKGMPSVTPQESKTGHWVHGEYCSECGCDVPAYIIDWKWQKDMNAKYCPNCGAKMESEVEDESTN